MQLSDRSQYDWEAFRRLWTACLELAHDKPGEHISTLFCCHQISYRGLHGVREWLLFSSNLNQFPVWSNDRNILHTSPRPWQVVAHSYYKELSESMFICIDDNHGFNKLLHFSTVLLVRLSLSESISPLKSNGSP